MEVLFANLVEICKSLPCHVDTDSGTPGSEIVLIGLNSIISAHWNEFTQNRWIFAILRNRWFCIFPTELWWFFGIYSKIILNTFWKEEGAVIVKYFLHPKLLHYLR
jgi:hypothetical protein